jgi:hypothetical protein
VFKEPVGPVAAFTPWNFPINQLVRKLCGALATGCSIIAKAPEETPASPAELVRAFVDAGIPAGVLGLVYGRPEMISAYLIPHPVIRKVTFTGSTAVGKQLAALAGAHMKRVTMELGGHAPVIVAADCDVDRAAKDGGRRQVPQRRAGVHLADALPGGQRGARALRRRPRRRDACAEAGPRPGGRHDDGPAGQPAPRGGGAAPDATTPWSAAPGWPPAASGWAARATSSRPRCSTTCRAIALVFNEEPFGPVAAVQGFDTLDEAIAEANRLPYGLAAYAFTGSCGPLTPWPAAGGGHAVDQPARTGLARAALRRRQGLRLRQRRRARGAGGLPQHQVGLDPGALTMNVLFIMADQLRWDHLSCAGHPYLKHAQHRRAGPARRALLAGLREQRRLWPSRMSYYTGRYPISHGATWNRVPLGWASARWASTSAPSARGHDLWLAGKTHVMPDDEGLARLAIEAEGELGHLLRRGGFREIDRHDGHHETRDADGYSGWLRRQGYDSPTPWSDYVISAVDERGSVVSGWQMRNVHLPARVAEPHSETAYTTDRAIDFMRERGDRPWVLHLSYVKPHWPYMAPAPYHAMYTADQCLPVVKQRGGTARRPPRRGGLPPARGKPQLRARRGRAPCAARPTRA